MACFVVKKDVKRWHLYVNNPRIASDLSGITYINGDDSESKMRIGLSNWLKQL